MHVASRAMRAFVPGDVVLLSDIIDRRREYLVLLSSVANKHLCCETTYFLEVR